MHISGCEETESRVMMFVVVPAEEFGRPEASILLAAKTFGIIGAIFQGLELGFRERIIVGDVWAGVCFGHTQIGHEQGYRFGSHRTATVGMDRELLRLNVLANTGGCDQFLGQAGGFAFGDQPTDRIAAEDIQDVVEIVIRPFSGSQEFRDTGTSTPVQVYPSSTIGSVGWPVVLVWRK